MRATNSGISAIIDPVGRVMSRTQLFTRETLVQDVARLEGATLFEYLGSWPGYLGLIALPTLLFWRRRQRKDEGSKTS